MVSCAVNEGCLKSLSVAHPTFYQAALGTTDSPYVHSPFAASLNPVEKKRTFGLPFQMQDRLCRQPVQDGSIGSVREEFYERSTPKTLERRGRSGFNGICIAVGSTSLGGHRHAQHSSYRYWRCLFECCYEPEHGNVVDSPGSGCASRWFLQSQQIEGRIHRGA